MNGSCPPALDAQTGCSQNINKPQTREKRREVGPGKTIAALHYGARAAAASDTLAGNARKAGSGGETPLSDV